MTDGQISYTRNPTEPKRLHNRRETAQTKSGYHEETD